MTRLATAALAATAVVGITALFTLALGVGLFVGVVHPKPPTHAGVAHE
jgi:hypothetical protein